MSVLRRTLVAFGIVGALVYAIWLLPMLLNPTPPTPDERRRDREWVDSSPYWLDRQACRWLSLCGTQHIRPDPPTRPRHHTGHDRDDPMGITPELRLRAREEVVDREVGSGTNTARMKRRGNIREHGARILREVPDYVTTYAPLVHLHSGENFWPSDIAEHVQHMVPVYANGSRNGLSDHVGLGNLQRFNDLNETVFLASEVDVETRPDWLYSYSSIPIPYPDDENDDWHRQSQAVVGDQVPHGPPHEYTTWWDADKNNPPRRIADPRHASRLHRHKQHRRQQRPIIMPTSHHHQPNTSGYSSAPSVLVLVDKGSGILDAFWFFFYSYNLGQTVAGIRFGNHVGDWEHCMVRFQNGVPRAMFLSEHAGGKAYAWQALEKRRRQNDDDDDAGPARPVIFSAIGSHAMYATPGDHPYVLPFGMLRDQTDRGPLWDPAQNTLAYWYDYEVDGDDDDDDDDAPDSLAPAAQNPHAETDWFHFTGPWGDNVFPLSDARQWRIFGQYHYVEGPRGPKFKTLERRKVCQTERCRILYSLEQGRRATWYS